MALTTTQEEFVRSLQTLAGQAETLAVEAATFVSAEAQSGGVIVVPAGRWYVSGYQPANPDLPNGEFEFTLADLTSAVAALQSVIAVINANMTFLREIQ